MSERLLFETRGLCKHFRRGTRAEVRALHDVSLTIPAGSFTVLTGASGSGKTTLLALLGTLQRPTAGQVLFEGSDLATYSDVGLARYRRGLGFIFQNFSLIPGLPVWENITYPLIPRGMGGRQRLALAQRLLDPLGLGDRLTARPRELSGGEQQRVALARALAGEPQAILADEPISNLDAENSRAVLGLLQQIHVAGKTVILAVHDPAVVGLATHVHELQAGRLKSCGAEA